MICILFVCLSIKVHQALMNKIPIEFTCQSFILNLSTYHASTKTESINVLSNLFLPDFGCMSCDSQLWIHACAF